MEYMIWGGIIWVAPGQLLTRQMWLGRPRLDCYLLVPCGLLGC